VTDIESGFDQDATQVEGSTDDTDLARSLASLAKRHPLAQSWPERQAAAVWLQLIPRCAVDARRPF